MITICTSCKEKFNTKSTEKDFIIVPENWCGQCKQDYLNALLETELMEYEETRNV